MVAFIVILLIKLPVIFGITGCYFISLVVIGFSYWFIIVNIINFIVINFINVIKANNAVINAIIYAIINKVINAIVNINSIEST